MLWLQSYLSSLSQMVLVNTRYPHPGNPVPLDHGSTFVDPTASAPRAVGVDVFGGMSRVDIFPLV